MKIKLYGPICALAVVLSVSYAGCFHTNHHSAYRSIHMDAQAGDIVHVNEELAENPRALESPNDIGRTPLHLASANCRIDVVTQLLDKGAKVDSRANDRATPLHLAAQEGCIDAVNVLLARGADVNAHDDKGRTPLARAKSYKQDSVVQLLQKRGGHE